MAFIFSTLFPIFAVIAVGYILGRKRFLNENFVAHLNGFVYWICLPCLIVRSLAGVSAVPDGTWGIVLIFFASTLLVLFAAIAFARATQMPFAKRGTFSQATFRANLAFVGIPVIQFASRDLATEESERLLAQAIFVFGPSMILYNAVSVILLLDKRGSSFGQAMGLTFKKLTKNPLIIASLIGGGVFILPSSLPGPIDDTLDLIGRIAGPAALICVGASMAFVSMEGRFRKALIASLFKCALLPLAAGLIAWKIGLDPGSTLVLLVVSGSPVAVASYTMAREMNGDAPLAAGSVVISTACSVPTLSLILLWVEFLRGQG